MTLAPFFPSCSPGSRMDFPHWCYPLSRTCLIDWEAWAAIGTFLAVFVAMFEIVRQNKLMRKTNEEAHQREIERDASVASRLALSLDHELFRYGNEMVAIVNSLTRDQVTKDPLAAIQFIHDNFPTDPLPLLTRFTDQLGVFGVKNGARLTHILGTWYSIAENPTAEQMRDAPRDGLIAGIAAFRHTYILAVRTVERGRQSIRPYADPYRTGYVELSEIAVDE